MIALACLSLSVAFGAAVLATASSEAFAVNCTDAQEAAADRQLQLSTRDKNASVKKHLPWGSPAGPAADNERLLVQRDYVIDYDSDLRVPVWVGYQRGRFTSSQA